MSKQQRSETMSKIRSRGNISTEIKMVQLLRANSIVGWRRHAKLPGRPDFVFRKKKIAVFIDGCFWHGCPTCYVKPRSNVAYWSAKIARNRSRSKEVNRELRRLGWQVLRFWEHSLKHSTTIMRRIRKALG